MSDDGSSQRSKMLSAMPLFAAALLILSGSTGASPGVLPTATQQPIAITGTITVTLDESGTGDIAMEWTEAMTPTGQCTGFAPAFRANGTISRAANIALNNEFPAERSSPAGTIRLRRVETFSGSLDGNVVNGTVTMSQDETLIAPAGPESSSEVDIPRRARR